MSVALSYRSWGSTAEADTAARTVASEGRVTAATAMQAVALLDAALLVVAAAAMGLPLGAWWTWAAMGAVATASVLDGHYHPRITLSVAREAGPLAACWAAPFLVLALAKVPGVSTSALVATAAVMAGAVIAVRCGQYWLIRALRTRGWFARAHTLRGSR